MEASDTDTTKILSGALCIQALLELRPAFDASGSV